MVNLFFDALFRLRNGVGSPLALKGEGSVKSFFRGGMGNPVSSFF